MKVAVAFVFGLIVASILGVESAAAKEKTKAPSDSEAEKGYEGCMEKFAGAAKKLDLSALQGVEKSCLADMTKLFDGAKISETLTKVIAQVNKAAEGALGGLSGKTGKDATSGIHKAFEGIKDSIAGMFKSKKA